MEYKENKFTKFLSGKGFYLVLAGCLIATGIAAWTAYIGISSSRQSASLPDGTSSSLSSSEISSDRVQAKPEESEPYTSSSTESLTTPPTVAEHFVYPLSGSLIKGFSGEKAVYSNTFSDMRVHSGLDISGEAGQAVGACGNGRVTEVFYDELWGHCVEVDHGNNVIARYYGLHENISVSQGDIVSAGTKLGLLSEIPSESADGIHLHLEIYRNDIAENPESIIESN